jgi:acetyl esterase/lipase
MADNGRSGADLVARRLWEASGGTGPAVAGIAVRSSAQARFPAQLDDIQAAIRWLRARADRYPLDAGRFAVMGDSSGGWVAAMAAVNGGPPGAAEHVRAAVAFYPPTDLLRMDEQMLPGAIDYFNGLVGATGGHNDPVSPESRLLGGPLQTRAEAARRANPITHIGPQTPPFLILHGQADRIVPYAQGEMLYQALARAGRQAELIRFPHGEHGDWDAFLTDPAARRDAVSFTTREGRPDLPRAAEPDWLTVVEFLRTALR